VWFATVGIDDELMAAGMHLEKLGHSFYDRAELRVAKLVYISAV
jgi:hypothetical protein